MRKDMIDRGYSYVKVEQEIQISMNCIYKTIKKQSIGSGGRHEIKSYIYYGNLEVH